MRPDGSHLAGARSLERGDSGAHLYPKSNKIIGVVYLGVGAREKDTP